MQVPFSTLVTSSVGKKIMTGLTGLGLCLFILSHLLGNFNLFLGPDAFNQYTKTLESFGKALYVIEALLVLAFVMHAVVGISVWQSKRRARPEAYHKTAYAGGNSKKSFASLSMLYTGLIILLFLFIHIKSLKFGPNMAEGYVTTVNGVEMRDMYKLTVEHFKNPFYAFGYALVMLLLGVHLRHGFWSAFQSLGLTHQRLKPLIFSVGILFASAMALGFFVLPLWIYFSR